ncbi:MAG: hypothetical protein EBR34_08690 [Sphingomonadaceae bacterium]|nr:hypothetical protein [Sphingomonadaceae bacterium]
MEDALAEMERRLAQAGIAVTRLGTEYWLVSDPGSETCIYVTITQNAITGRPDYWTPCAPSYALEYTTPISAKIADIDEQIAMERLQRNRAASAPRDRLPSAP